MVGRSVCGLSTRPSRDSPGGVRLSRVSATDDPTPIERGSRGRTVAARGTWRRRVAARLAAEHGGVVHRAELRAKGITHDDVRSEVRAHRWSVLGRHTIHPGALPNGHDQGDGPVEWPARAWWAVWETGSGVVLDGASALRAAGLRDFRETFVHVIAPRGSHPRSLPGVRLHVSRRVDRWPGAGIPRLRVESAVIHAAQRAVSDRQAALVLAMTVQQRLVLPERVLDQWRLVRRSPRRELLDAVILDVCAGAQALSELDFARLCRKRGLPEPTRQVVRSTSTGRIYLDVWWEELQLGAEVEGGHHTQGLNAVDDALRQNEVVLQNGTLLRLPVLGLRLAPDRFMDQVAAAHRAADERPRQRVKAGSNGNGSGG